MRTIHLITVYVPWLESKPVLFCHAPGGLTTVQLTGAVNSSKPQAIAVRQQPTLQYQIQPLMSQAQPHAQQQQQQVQQVILQPQQQFVVQEQQQTVQLQQTELPINVQVRCTATTCTSLRMYPWWSSCILYLLACLCNETY